MRLNRPAIASWFVVIEYRLHISAFALDDHGQRLLLANARRAFENRWSIFPDVTMPSSPHVQMIAS